MQRRQFLQATAATAVGLSVIDTATADGPYVQQPDHVTLTGYDDAPSAIERYHPRLVTRHLDINPDSAYAWRATSSEYDYDWYCYWVWYSLGQTGVSSEDSHVPDREPIYVAVDDSGEVAKIVFDEIHYLAGTRVSPPTDGDHPLLYVVNPWHPYEVTTEQGELIDLNDMHDRYEPWLDAGWTVDQRSVVDPPFIQSRRHWWPDNSLGFSLTASLTRVFRGTGFIPGRDT